MPAFTRYRSSSPIYTVPAPDALPSKTVGFVPGPSPVTCISRTLTNDELWKLYYFETHARLCAACRDPYSVHRARGRLCTNGHHLAQDVAEFVWSRSNGQETFDARSLGTHLVRLEMPPDYTETRSLLRAMERSLRHRRQTPIVSFSKPSPVPSARASPTPKAAPLQRRASTAAKEPTSPPRSPTSGYASSTRSQSSRGSDTSPQRYERRQPEIVDWPEAEYEIREPSQIIQPSRLQRVTTPEPVSPKDSFTSSSSSKPASSSKGASFSARASSPLKAAAASPLRNSPPPKATAASPLRNSSPPKATASKRFSLQPAPSSSRTPQQPAVEPAARPRASRTVPSEAKDARRRSMYADAGTYNVEVREPKPRPKRYSMLMF